MLDTSDPDLIGKYNEAADLYFRTIPDPQALFEKPYAPAGLAPMTLLRVGLMLELLQLGPGHLVVDFGSGTGWLGLMLARMTCRVISVDVSRMALELGREAGAASGIPVERLPTLLHYDGHRLPLPDGSVDRIACFDAMHHVPNKSEVLREMHRVLRQGGRACLAEPGHGHADTPDSRSESENYGVLEDEVPPVEFAELALGCGFTSVKVLPVPSPEEMALPVHDYRRLLDGDSTAPQQRLQRGDALIALQKGDEPTDSHRPGTLRARIEILRPLADTPCGAIVTIPVRVTNTGDTIWRALPQDGGGRGFALDYDRAFLDKPIVPGERTSDAPVRIYRRYIEHHGFTGRVTLGVRLRDAAGTMLDRDHGRGFLPGDLSPGQRAEIELRVRAPMAPGLYRLDLDMVDEYVAWFASHGSEVATDVMNVQGELRRHDSRRPGLLLAELRLVAREATSDGSRIVVKATNVGDTAWIDAAVAGDGRVQLGLQTLDVQGRVLVRDWARVPLPRIVGPGDEVVLEARVPPAGPGGLRLDMVAEGITWFEDRGSRALTLPP